MIIHNPFTARELEMPIVHIIQLRQRAHQRVIRTIHQEHHFTRPVHRQAAEERHEELQRSDRERVLVWCISRLLRYHYLPSTYKY